VGVGWGWGGGRWGEGGGRVGFRVRAQEQGGAKGRAQVRARVGGFG
jgi:hypothetical protein